MNMNMKLLCCFLLPVGLTAPCGFGQEAKPPAQPNVEAAKDGVKHVDAAGAKILLDKAAAQKESRVSVLDVRTPEEFKEAHIAGAVNIDILSKDFGEKVAALDRDRTYIVHCQSGRRSTKSLETLRKLGFKSIVHLDGGLAGWQKAALPLEKSK